MKTDLYTKTMLTLIAFSLIVLCSRDLNWPASANAQDAPAKPRGPIQVQVVNPPSSPVNTKIVDCGDDFNEFLPIVIREVDEDLEVGFVVAVLLVGARDSAADRHFGIVHVRPSMGQLESADPATSIQPFAQVLIEIGLLHHAGNDRCR